MNETAKKFSMEINIQKTNRGVVVDITVDGQRVEQVQSSKCLGSIISEDGRSLTDVITDVKYWIALAKEAFNKSKELLTKGLSQTLKKRLVKVLI